MSALLTVRYAIDTADFSRRDGRAPHDVEYDDLRANGVEHARRAGHPEGRARRGRGGQAPLRFWPAGLALVGRIVRARARGRPIFLSHLVTTRCNGHCAVCLWRDQTRGEMPADTIDWLYRQAASAGIAQVVIWGGEPFLRDDLPALLRSAKRAGLVVHLITNGWFAQERWPEVRGLIETLIVSLDDVGDAHDRQRGLPGLYDRLERFVAELRCDHLRPRLLVNTVLSRLNEGALPRVAAVARRWGAGLYFCPMQTGYLLSGGFDPAKESLALAPQQLQLAALETLRLKADGYPILSSRRYLQLLARDPALTGYRCRMPRAMLTVEPDGAVRDCLRIDDPLLNVGDLMNAARPLTDLFITPRYRAMVAGAAGCTQCNNPDVIETSWLWDLRPSMTAHVLRLLSS